jgi:hypothetical protein
MKSFKKYDEFLNEIGEIRNPYKYEMISDPSDNDRVYRFINKNGIEYLITFHRLGMLQIDVEFGIVDGRKIDHQIVANVGDPLTIFSTVFDALVKYVKENPEVEIIKYNPSKNFQGDVRREKIYMEYMKKNFEIKKTWTYGHVIVKIR